MDRRAWLRFRRNPGARLGLWVVVALVAFALVGPWLAGHPPNQSDFAAGKNALGIPEGPSARHWLGVDHLLRDLFSRLAHGARISLGVAFLATALSVGVGALVGIVAGWCEGTRLGFVDSLLMRFVDVGLSFPYLLLVMAIGAAVDEVTLLTILLILGLTSWFGTARLIRGKTLQVRQLDYVVASRALGRAAPGILLRHVLPAVAGPLIVIGSASVAQMIIAESVLSYLQVGLPPPTATWGRMLQEAQAFITVAPHQILAPGLLIFASVLGFNLVGEGLRDALDPKEP